MELDPRAFVEEVLRIAGETVGTTPRTAEYLASVGTGDGPWTTAFPFFCIREACLSVGIPAEEAPMVRSGSPTALALWADEKKCLYRVPHRGDLFILYHGGHYRHTGFVVQAQGTHFSTVEGNVSPEGIGVFRRERPLGTAFTFVRYRETLGDQAAVAEEVPLLVGGNLLTTVRVIHGTGWCPVRAWADHFGLAVTWDNFNQALMLNGRAVPSQTIIAPGEGIWAPVRELAFLAGLTCNLERGKVLVDWPKSYRAARPQGPPAGPQVRPPSG